jgi:hypothetical protein
MSDNTDNTDNTDNVYVPLSFFTGSEDSNSCDFSGMDNDTLQTVLNIATVGGRVSVEYGGTNLELIEKCTAEMEKRKKEGWEKPRKKDVEIKSYTGYLGGGLNIMRILFSEAAREAEKVSCRPGCYGARQKFEETLDKMFSCDFESDNEEDEEDGKDSNVVVEKPNVEKEDLDADRVTDSGEIDASGNKTHIYEFALRPQGSESQKDQIAKLHKPFKKNNKLFKKNK